MAGRLPVRKVGAIIGAFGGSGGQPSHGSAYWDRDMRYNVARQSAASDIETAILGKIKRMGAIC